MLVKSFGSPVIVPSKANLILSKSIGVQTPYAKKITFGDGDWPGYYSFDQEVRNRVSAGQKIQGETAESAFSSFYDSVKSELANKKNMEERKGSQRDYFVRESMPYEKDPFVRTLSQFTSKHGNIPNFNSWDSAIDNYLTNTLGLTKPKWYEIFNDSIFREKKAILNDMSGFFRRGLVDIKNLR